MNGYCRMLCGEAFYSKETILGSGGLRINDYLKIKVIDELKERNNY